MAGDWIAVARIKNQSAATTGAQINLYLRQATDRSQWVPAGEFTAPEAGPDTRIFWDRGELVLISFANNAASMVTTRRFPGRGITVKDDDRAKLALAAAVQFEPEGYMREAAECYAEFPLPVLADTVVAYELTGGTAEFSEDYIGGAGTVAGTVTIPAGSSRALIPIILFNDSKVEPDKTLGIRLTVSDQPSVEGVMVIRDTNPTPVVTARAAPLMEGYLDSQVMLQVKPAADSYPQIMPLNVQWKTGGFANPTVIPPLAAAATDLPDKSGSLQLTQAYKEESFSLTAGQDTLVEPAEERVKAVWQVSPVTAAAGTYGVGLQAPLPSSTGTPYPPLDGDELVTAGGDWVFLVKPPVPLEPLPEDPPGQPLTGSMVIECFHRGAPGEPELTLVQHLLLDSERSYNVSTIQLAADGQTLGISSLRSGYAGSAVNLLSIFRATGPPAAPWELDWEWEGPPATDSATTYPLHLVSDAFIGWGPWLLERSSGPWRWRLLNDALVNQFEFLSQWKMLDTDGRHLVVDTDSTVGVKIYHRVPGQIRSWQTGTPIPLPKRGPHTAIGGTKIRGRTLFLKQQAGDVIAFHNYDAYSWQYDKQFTNTHFSQLSATEESAIVVRVGPVAWIFSRNGGSPFPWNQTGMLPLHLDLPTNVFVNTAAAHQKVIYFWQPVDGSAPRILIYEPGLPIGLVDDDSLTFRIVPDGTGVQPMAAEESYTAETVKNMKLLINRRPPVPLSIRVHSQDTGSATSGQDYAPVDRVFSFGPDLADPSLGEGFPLRIFSDRLLEGNETFQFVVDPPVFGATPAPTVFTITDPAATGFRVTPATTMLYEPVSGVSTQSVEFTLQQAFDRDVSFTPNRAVAGIGTQFDFPAAPVILKAGSNILRIPVQVFADSIVENSLAISLRLSSSPPIAGLPTSTSLTLVDSSITGLGPDGNYTIFQGATLTADGAGGRPAGLQANDPAPPPGTYQPYPAPSWGEVVVQPDGNFTATPGPNAIGPLQFGYLVGSAPFAVTFDPSAAWKYLHPLNGANPALTIPDFNNQWHRPGFNDSTWSTGFGTMSYGGFNIPVFPNTTDIGTPAASQRYTGYFRTTFTSTAATTAALTLRLYCDDGAIIYINGMERARVRTGTPSTIPANFPGTYGSTIGGSQTAAEEGTLLTVNLGSVPLNNGSNLLAISLFNITNTSSDLGLRVESLRAPAGSDKSVPVQLTVVDANLPPVAQPDTFTCPANATFLSSDEYGPGLLANDGLLSPAGNYYDPLISLTVSAVSAGTLEMIGQTGHFRYTPPPDFTGSAGFTYQLGDKDGLSSPVLVTLIVAATLPFDLWRQSNLPGGGPGAAPNADGDGDGLNNLSEYAFGSPPQTPLNPPGTGLVLTDGNFGQIPGISLNLRRASDLAWTVECSPSLIAPVWQSLYESRGLNYLYKTPGTNAVLLNPTASSLTLIARPATSLTDTPRLFYRLRTERIAPQ